VAPLDRDDLGRSRKCGLGQVRGLAVVGEDTRVLEENRSLQERGLAPGRVAEVELRPRARVLAERFAQVGHVRALVPRHDLRKGPDVSGQVRVLHGGGVEGRLEVLEQQREVEDRAILGG
jgi:hypothetical protein